MVPASLLGFVLEAPMFLNIIAKIVLNKLVEVTSYSGLHVKVWTDVVPKEKKKDQLERENNPK